MTGHIVVRFLCSAHDSQETSTSPPPTLALTLALTLSPPLSVTVTHLGEGGGSRVDYEKVYVEVCDLLLICCNQGLHEQLSVLLLVLSVYTVCTTL